VKVALGSIAFEDLRCTGKWVFTCCPYATHNLYRIEPLLQRQFVTVDQVEQAKTAVNTWSQAAKQVRSQLALAEAGLLAAEAQEKQAQATVAQPERIVGPISAKNSNANLIQPKPQAL